jgi:DNA repair protein RecN (Recombination protein N)
MIEEIRIRGLGVIEQAELSLGPGLTVLTGETGAGKTMVLTALGLLLGGRAESATVRLGADRAEVEGVLAVAGHQPVADRAVEAGAVLEDDRVIVARTLSAEGRSRAWLGGRSVPVAVLADLAEDLVAVHGQSSQVALARPSRQRDLLDAFGSPATTQARGAVARAHAELVAIEAELATIRGQARERAREADLLRHGLDEIAALAPEAGEETSLAAEEARLAHADQLRVAMGEVRRLLAGDDDSPEDDVLGWLASARHSLETARTLDPGLGPAADRLAEVTYLLVDLAADVSSYLVDLEVDPQRLAKVSQRRAGLAQLFRRYGEDVPAVLEWAAAARDRLADLDSDTDRVAELEQARAHVRNRLGEAAGELSRARAEAASRLGGEVTTELHALAMPQALLDVTVRQREDPDGVPVAGRTLVCTAEGVDQVEMLLSAHSGAPPRPLDKGASGGELSRTMLALEVVLAQADPVPTLVFDEVDAGVGGRAAVDVGRRLARLARHRQVLVVTHLPQVAAFADHHYVVHKNTAGHITSTGVHRVTDTERAEELARMMAGMETSQAARRHARELLQMAAAER